MESAYLACVRDPDLTYKNEVDYALGLRKNALAGIGGYEHEIHDHLLFEPIDHLVRNVDSFLQASKGNVIIDISSLPKRFFFPMIKRALQTPRIKNLLVCYTIPRTYRQGEMAENFDGWRTIPLFQGDVLDEKPDVFVVGAGHMAMGLPEQVEATTGSVKVRVFVPFPGHPDSLRPVWEFVRDIERNSNRVERKVVAARDVPEVFNYLIAETLNEQRVLLAPFGPKPISVAMCIFACNAKPQPAVYYTQPRAYPPDYSTGVMMVGNKPEILAYCIRLDGRDLYRIEPASGYDQ